MKVDRRWWPWLVGATGVAVFSVLVAVLVRAGGETAVAALSVLISATAGVLGWSRHRARPVAPASQAELDQAAEALAAMVRRQWTEEEAARGLLDPHPLAVRWRSDQTETGDHLRLVGRAVSGRSDDVPGFAAAFRALPRHRLILLGEPGAGKTTLAVLLVRELLRDAPPGEPVPVLLDLAPWNPRKESLGDWMARRIHEDYPALRNYETYGRDAARKLVSEGRVLPVLDGFDELPAELRPRALAAVNRAVAVHEPLVLASRTAEYRAAVEAGDVVTAAAAVVALPVKAEDVVAYLQSVVAPRRAAAWRPVTEEITRNPDGPLARALSLPLNVWLARTVYSAPDSDPAELLRHSDAESVRRHLLDSLVPAVFAGEPAPADPSGTHVRRTAANRWRADDAELSLGFLARHLQRQGTDDIAWWELHRALPPNPVGPLSGPVAGAAVGLGAGCMAGDYFHWALPPLSRLLCFLVVTLATAVASATVLWLAFVGRGAGRADRHGRGPLAEVARRTGIWCAVLLPLAPAVGAVIEYWARTAASTGIHYEVGVAAHTWLRAALWWLAAMSALTVGVLGCALVRRRMPPRPGRRWGRRVPLGKIAAFTVLFWVGAETASQLCFLSTRQETGRPLLDLALLDPGADLRFANQRAVFRAALFLLIAGIMAFLGLGGSTDRPSRLSFRAPVSSLLRPLPACVGGGLASGVALVVVLGLAVAPWAAGVPLWARLAASGLMGAFFGVLFGLGLAVLRWARLPTDLEQETPQSTLRGEHVVANAVLVFAMVPPLLKWAVTAWWDLATSPHLWLQAFGAWLQTLEANLAVGLAAGLLALSNSAYFRYREAGLRLSRISRLPRRPLAFLEDARLLHVLRQVGPVYQFVHADFRERIATVDSRSGGGAELETAPS
ncbi:NACHT domain-containing protein [Streptomyces sp. TRM76323]|uniref:NACHT domain-containing protein n=1 Tax=Streptomyces tamarix TaxID=3078565 RepID=A0ABU3QIQ5_9ACTN|nr:NACHT domain-containing protein [Streptomyces tamarix]MDT9682653.1 NACHT domain-containing protein [Streptomyces tamarix]